MNCPGLVPAGSSTGVSSPSPAKTSTSQGLPRSHSWLCRREGVRSTEQARSAGTGAPLGSAEGTHTPPLVEGDTAGAARLEGGAPCWRRGGPGGLRPRVGRGRGAVRSSEQRRTRSERRAGTAPRPRPLPCPSSPHRRGRKEGNVTRGGSEGRCDEERCFKLRLGKGEERCFPRFVFLNSGVAIKFMLVGSKLKRWKVWTRGSLPAAVTGGEGGRCPSGDGTAFETQQHQPERCETLGRVGDALPGGARRSPRAPDRIPHGPRTARQRRVAESGRTAFLRATGC